MSPRPAFDALQISALDNTATLLKSVRISDEVVVGGQTDVLRIKALTIPLSGTKSAYEIFTAATPL